jgi:hypothetical protein
MTAYVVGAEKPQIPAEISELPSKSRTAWEDAENRDRLSQIAKAITEQILPAHGGSVLNDGSDGPAILVETSETGAKAIAALENVAYVEENIDYRRASAKPAPSQP